MFSIWSNLLYWIQRNLSDYVWFQCTPSLLSQDVNSAWPPNPTDVCYRHRVSSDRKSKQFSRSRSPIPMALSLKVNFRKILSTCEVQIWEESWCMVPGIGTLFKRLPFSRMRSPIDIEWPLRIFTITVRWVMVLMSYSACYKWVGARKSQKRMNQVIDVSIRTFLTYGKLNSYTKILGGIGIHEQSLGDYLSSTTA